MCGHVGMAGNNLTEVDKGIFIDGLRADQTRGKHSTGIAVAKGVAEQVFINKLAYPAGVYLELPSIQQFCNLITKSNVVIGHNRHATKGAASDPAGAHPFQHGHITLAHNGSLKSHYGLTRGHTTQTFTVDSEAITKAFEIRGAEEVIPELDGAFALVWVDSKEQTLNFVRNDERRFGICMNTKLNKIWWASEIEMMHWLLKRGDDLYGRAPVDFDESFELPVGQWLKIPLTEKGIDLEARTMTEVKLKPKVVTTCSRYTGGAYHSKGKHSTPATNATTRTTNVTAITPSRTKKKEEPHTPYLFNTETEKEYEASVIDDVARSGRMNPLARKFISSLDMSMEEDAVDLESRIPFTLEEFVPYSKGSLSGTGKGVMLYWPYSPIKVHSLTKAAYDKLVNENENMHTSFFVGMDTPKSADVKFDKDGLLADAYQYDKFFVNLSRDKIRLYDYENETVEAGNSKKQGETHWETTNDKESVFLLSDGSALTVDGTARLIGEDRQGLPGNHRYYVRGLTFDVRDGSLISVGIGYGNVIFQIKPEHLESGTVAADFPQEKSCVGPNSKMITPAEYEVRTEQGCNECGADAPPPEQSDLIAWMGDTEFFCSECAFNEANKGYN